MYRYLTRHYYATLDIQSWLDNLTAIDLVCYSFCDIFCFKNTYYIFNTTLKYCNSFLCKYGKASSFITKVVYQLFKFSFWCRNSFKKLHSTCMMYWTYPQLELTWVCIAKCICAYVNYIHWIQIMSLH